MHPRGGQSAADLQNDDESSFVTVTLDFKGPSLSELVSRPNLRHRRQPQQYQHPCAVTTIHASSNGQIS